MPRGISRFVDMMNNDPRRASNISRDERVRRVKAIQKALSAHRAYDAVPWPKPHTDIATALRGRLYGPKKTDGEKAALQFRRTG